MTTCSKKKSDTINEGEPKMNKKQAALYRKHRIIERIMLISMAALCILVSILVAVTQ
jgi:hypothetical protein